MIGVALRRITGLSESGTAAAGNPRLRLKLTHYHAPRFLDRAEALEYTTRFDLSPLVRTVAVAMTQWCSPGLQPGMPP